MNQVQIYIEKAHEATWRPSEWDHDLVCWLLENVGNTAQGIYRLPLCGSGWSIERRHEFEPSNSDGNYSPESGERLGYWVTLADPNMLVLLKLSGLLDNRPRGPAYEVTSLDYDPEARFQIINF